MNIYAIGDLHLSLNENIEKPMDVFGSEWENHSFRLLEAWDASISDEDLVLLCGDISWALKLPEAMADLDYIHDRPGKKVLIKGNHDLWWTSIKRLNQLYEDLFFLQNDFFLFDETAICGSRGWTCPGNEDFKAQDMKIYERELLRLRMSLEAASLAGYGKGQEGAIITMMHFPPTNDQLEDSGFTRIFEEFGVETVVYGHLHGAENHGRSLKGVRNGVNYRLVAFDYLKGKPERLL
jgi:hypothetical protein